jgi:predicted dinucleotide-binding enzyme
LTVFGTDSLAEQIQRAFPMTKVVKTLNTVTARVMTHPLEVANGDHHVFISANDAEAKAQVTELLRSFGWIHIFDLGDLSTARGTEAYLLLWVRLYGTMNTSMINVKVMK